MNHETQMDLWDSMMGITVSKFVNPVGRFISQSSWHDCADNEDLKQHAWIVFAKCVKGYDDDESKFITYYTRALINERARAIRHYRFIRIPEDWSGRTSIDNARDYQKQTWGAWQLRLLSLDRPCSKPWNTQKDFMDVEESCRSLSRLEDEELLEGLQKVIGDRTWEVIRRRSTGETLAEVATSLGITREGVRQLVVTAHGKIVKEEKGRYKDYYDHSRLSETLDTLDRVQASRKKRQEKIRNRKREAKRNEEDKWLKQCLDLPIWEQRPVTRT